MKFCTSCKLIQPIDLEQIICTYCSGPLREISEEEGKEMISKGIIKSAMDDNIGQNEKVIEVPEKRSQHGSKFEKYNPIETSNQKNIKYPALEWIIDILNIFSYIYLIGGIIIGILIGAASTLGGVGFYSIIFAIISMVSGTFLWLITKASAEILKIMIDIEKNTRK